MLKEQLRKNRKTGQIDWDMHEAFKKQMEVKEEELICAKERIKELDVFLLDI